MLIVLCYILMTFVTTFTLGDVTVESVGAGVRKHALDGKVSKDDILFHEAVNTKITCASTCVKYDCCFAFTTSRKDAASKPMTCRGYPRLPDPRTTVPELGSRTYFVNKTTSASSWLERPCRQDSDCPESNSKCFETARHCLCTPGYYYSHCRDSCVRDCPQSDLQKTFLEYPLYFLENVNFAVVPCQSREQGQQSCQAIKECRSFNMYKRDKKCYIKNVTALRPGVTFKKHEFDHHYQRTCL